MGICFGSVLGGYAKEIVWNDQMGFGDQYVYHSAICNKEKLKLESFINRGTGEIPTSDGLLYSHENDI